ncbi:MAG: glycosyl hydrolase, partial [Saprospiraceae bacterium]|nr:glycosyl hydrolase [Saprospiraceae bacterium]
TNYTDKIKNEEIKAYAGEIDSVMTKVEKALYQTQNKSGQDPLNFPIRLTNKLAHLNSLSQMGNTDFPPTDAALKVKEEIAELIDVELEEWTIIKTKMLPDLNKMIRDKALDVIILEENK